jgi:hypothetical protein
MGARLGRLLVDPVLPDAVEVWAAELEALGAVDVVPEPAALARAAPPPARAPVTARTPNSRLMRIRMVDLLCGQPECPA